MSDAKGPSPLDWFLFFGCVAVWGSAYAGMAIAVKDIPPLWIACGRMLAAAAFMLALLPLLKQRLPPLSDKPRWRMYASIGVVGTALPFFLFALAAAHAPSAIVAICNGGSPFFTALLAHWLLQGDRLTLTRALSVALGFAGLVTLAAPGLFGPDASARAEVWGVLAAVAGAACYALANVQVKQAPLTDAAVGTTIYCLAGAIAIAPFALALEPIPLNASWQAFGIVALLGVVNTALAGIAYVLLVQRRGPVFTSFTTYLMPIWAMGLGVTFLGERPGPAAFAALAMIIAALALYSWRPSQAKGRSGHQG